MEKSADWHEEQAGELRKRIAYAASELAQKNLRSYLAHHLAEAKRLRATGEFSNGAIMEKQTGGFPLTENQRQVIDTLRARGADFTAASVERQWIEGEATAYVDTRMPARRGLVRMMVQGNREARMAKLRAIIAAHEISEANGAEARRDENGKVIVDMCTCGTCGLSWNDALISSYTPAPSARCPYEYIHEEIAELRALERGKR